MKKRLFVDMDGVLAKFHPEASLEELHRPGYFESLDPQRSVVDAVREIIEANECDVYVLSAVLSDEAAKEKGRWLERYLPTLPKDHQIYLPCGASKSDAVLEATGTLFDDDILIDDFTPNLKDWHGAGVKLLNGINHSKRTWKGLIVNGEASADLVRIAIVGIIVAMK